MKTYIYSTTHKKVNKNGHTYVWSQVYRIKNNRPHYIGVITWNCSSFQGEDAEIRDWLIAEKELPKSAKDLYLFSNDKFNIFKVG